MKILMRASMSPRNHYTVEDILTNNRIGSNLGNMLFPYAVMRALATPGTTIDTLSLYRDLKKQEIEKINSEYSYFVIPLANAFRTTFLEDLERLSTLIEQLTIPCIVVGVGLQMKVENALKHEALCNGTKRFMDAVLKRSAKVGVRGESTARFLAGLGYVEEKHFTVIGCPSLYLYGPALPEFETKELTSQSRVSMNSKVQLKPAFHDFMYRSKREFDDACYVPQVLAEIRQMYYGKPNLVKFHSPIPRHFPMQYSAQMQRNPFVWQAKAFLHPQPWLDYLSNRDFSFGSRIHGNIAAILAGIPCFILVSDERIKELVEYHNIPHGFIDEITEKSTIFDFYEKSDFQQIHKGHRQRFAHYVDFLHENKLYTVFDKKLDDIPFPKEFTEYEYSSILTPFADATPKERRRRNKECSLVQQTLAKISYRSQGPFS